MNAVLSQPQTLSSFENIVLPSRGRFVAETDTEIKNPLEATVKLFDIPEPEFVKAIAAIVPDGLGAIKADESTNRPAVDNTAKFREALVEKLVAHFKNHFKDSASIANLRDRLDQSGSPTTNITELKEITQTTAFSGTRKRYEEILIGALSESLELLIPATKAELPKPRTAFERAIERLAYKSGKKNDPSKKGAEVVHDFSAVKTELSKALSKIIPADFLKKDTQITEIRIGKLQLLFSDTGVVIIDKISNIKTTIQIDVNETDDKKKFFTELLNNLKGDSLIASSQQKFSDAILQLITASAGSVLYETYDSQLIPPLPQSHATEKIEEIIEKAPPAVPSDIPPLAEDKDAQTAPVDDTIGKTVDEEELEIIGPEFVDPYAPKNTTESEKKAEKVEEKIEEKTVEPIAVPETPSPTDNTTSTPPETVKTPPAAAPSQPSLLEELREEMALFRQSLAKGDPSQIAELPTLRNSLSARTNHGDYQSKGVISNLNVYTELGQLYAQITTKDSKGNDTLLSFRLNEGASNEDLLQYLAHLGSNLEKDTGSSIANSKTVLELLAIGQIQSIQPKNGGEVVLEKVNWLGTFLAAEAQINNVTFKNSNLDLSGQSSVISGCKFEGCRISMNLVGAQINDSVFDKKTIITGRLAGAFKGGELHANAFTLNLKETQFELKDTRKALRGVIFDKNLIPDDIKVYCTPITDKRLKFEQEQVEERFNQDTIRAIIHEYSQANLSTTVGGYSGVPLLSSNWRIIKDPAGDKIDQKVMQSVLTPAVDGVNDEYIDLYPPESDLLDKKKAEETTRLRILMAKNGRMYIKYDTAQELEGFTHSEKVQKTEGIIYGSNLKIFQEVLNFYHVSRSEKPIYSSNFVEVKRRAVIAVIAMHSRK